MTTTDTQARTVTLTTREWRHPTTGEVRHYLDNDEIVEMRVAQKGVIDPENARRIRQAKFWLDSAGNLHMDDFWCRATYEESIRDMLEAVVGPVSQDEIESFNTAGQFGIAVIKARQETMEAEARFHVGLNQGGGRAIYDAATVRRIAARLVVAADFADRANRYGQRTDAAALAEPAPHQPPREAPQERTKTMTKTTAYTVPEMWSQAERAERKLRDHEAVRRGIAKVELTRWQDQVSGLVWPGCAPEDEVTVDACTIRVVRRQDGDDLDEGFDIFPDSPETVKAGLVGKGIIGLLPREAADNAIAHYTPILDALLRAIITTNPWWWGATDKTRYLLRYLNGIQAATGDRRIIKLTLTPPRPEGWENQWQEVIDATVWSVGDDGKAEKPLDSITPGLTFPGPAARYSEVLSAISPEVLGCKWRIAARMADTDCSEITIVRL